MAVANIIDQIISPELVTILIILKTDLYIKLIDFKNMGIYWITYICVGTFGQEPKIKYQIAEMDQIIERHEWEQGYVSLTEVVDKLGDKFEFEVSEDDLYFEEVLSSTYGDNRSKYLLIKNKYCCKPKI